MSRENVELVRRCFDLFGRGEMEAVLRYIDPAIETIEPPEIPGSASYRGHSGLAKAYEHWASQWDDFRVELEELIDAGSDVVAVTTHHGTGRASGANVGGLVAYVFTVRDGKLARMQIFNTRAEALVAAGLRK
jgi:ketosteroid isomerase-like protein